MSVGATPLSALDHSGATLRVLSLEVRASDQPVEADEASCSNRVRLKTNRLDASESHHINTARGDLRSTCKCAGDLLTEQCYVWDFGPD